VLSFLQGFSFITVFLMLGALWFIFKEYRDAEGSSTTTSVTENTVEAGGVVTTTTTTETHSVKY